MNETFQTKEKEEKSVLCLLCCCIEPEKLIVLPCFRLRFTSMKSWLGSATFPHVQDFMRWEKCPDTAAPGDTNVSSQNNTLIAQITQISRQRIEEIYESDSSDSGHKRVASGPWQMCSAAGPHQGVLPISGPQFRWRRCRRIVRSS